MPFRKPTGDFFIRPAGESGWFMLLSLKRERDRHGHHIRKHRPCYWLGRMATVDPNTQYHSSLAPMSRATTDGKPTDSQWQLRP